MFVFLFLKARLLLVLGSLSEEKVIPRYFNPQTRPLFFHEVVQALANHLNLILALSQLAESCLVLFTFLANFLLEDDGVATLLVLRLHLVLLFLFRGVEEVIDGAPQLRNAVPAFTVATIVQVVALDLNLALNVCQRLSHHWLDHE